MKSVPKDLAERFKAGDARALARLLTLVENDTASNELLEAVFTQECPGHVVGVTGAMGVLSDPLCEDVRDMAARGTTKPIIATWNSPKIDERGFELLVESQVPLFRSFRNCFTALTRTAGVRAGTTAVRERPSLPRTLPAAAKRVLAGAKGGVLDADREGSRHWCRGGRKELMASSPAAAGLPVTIPGPGRSGAQCRGGIGRVPGLSSPDRRPRRHAPGGLGFRTTQRKPTWLVDVSTGWAWRAAGRYRRQ